jgi:hypothetical protein
MLPANDQITSGRIVGVFPEFATLVLKLDPHRLPAILPRIDAALRFAVGIGVVNRLKESDLFFAVKAQPRPEDAMQWNGRWVRT